MKKIFILLMLLLNITILTAQNSPSVNDNTIVINTINDIKTIKLILIENGYSIIESDIDIGYLLTEYKSIEGSVYAQNLSANITILLKDNKIKMYSNYKFKGSSTFGGDDYSGRADYQKRKNVGRRLAFEQLIKISEKLGTDIEFIKE